MATVTLSIPDAALPRVIAAFVGRYNWPTTIDGVPNPETQAQFAKRMVAEFIRHTVRDWELGQVIAASTPPAPPVIS